MASLRCRSRTPAVLSPLIVLLLLIAIGTGSATMRLPDLHQGQGKGHFLIPTSAKETAEIPPAPNQPTRETRFFRTLT